MAGMFDISVLGDKEVSRAMELLPEKSQKNVMRTALRRSGERLKNAVLLNLSGNAVEERTGRYVRAMESERIRVFIQKGFGVISTLDLPSRAALGISPGAQRGDYYPAILEYGSPPHMVKGRMHPGFPAKAPIRTAVDAKQDREQGRMVADISKGIANQWKRLNK